jgi:hypothetical protein
MEMNTLLWTLLIVEIFPAIYMVCKGIEVILDALEEKYNKILDRCAYDADYRNDVASVIFFFQDMGPNISSFSVIALLISSEEKYTILTVVFFTGIIMKQLSRKLKKLFYSEIEMRSSV